MDNYEIELEKFINWFASIEAIPGETRIDFLNHIIEVGYMDHKAEQFVEDALTHLAKVSQKEAEELKEQLEALEEALAGQEEPELSLVGQALQDAEEQMGNLAGGLKDEFAKFEKEEAKQEEHTDQKDSKAKVKKAHEEL